MLSTPEKIKHLYWRAGFGCSPEEWQELQSQSLETAINHLFADAAEAPSVRANYQDGSEQDFQKMNKADRKAIRDKEKEMLFQQNAQWVRRMADPKQSSLLEKMTLFWHGHFACVNNRSKFAYRQINTLRTHALGNFRTFVKAMARDVAMIRFLNNQQNKKQQPNENFAREVMELFTIGRGNYSEQDIQEAARAFTGWSSDMQGNFKFRKFQHDYGRKMFMSKTGTFDGDDIIDIILDRRETADFITRKIYRYFVNEQINESQVRQLADRFFASDYDIKDLMQTIFSSDWFYQAPNVGTKIKSPVELLAGMMRSLHVHFEQAMPILFVERVLGQVLFKPPNVAGWASGQNWIDNSTLMFRLNLATYLFQAADVDIRVKEEFEAKRRNKAIRKIKAEVDLNPLFQLFEQQSEAAIFNQLRNYFLQAPTQINLKSIRPYLSTQSKSDLIKSLTMRLLSLPEYQLC